MIKHVEFDLFNNQGEKVVDILDLNSAHLEKTAEISDELKEAISEIKPKPDKSYILVNAMGAGEYWGANKNADFFPEKSLQEYHKTFESAGVFKHHRNKDPKQSLGKVAFSHYNKDMHRVELLLEVDKKKAPDVVQRIQDNEKVAVSMGCKVPYDICLSKDILIITKDGLKCLEDIEEGNEVLSHTGQFKKVNAISKRNIEKFIRLKVFGDYFDLESSHEHPFLVAKKDQFAKYGVIRSNNLDEELVTDFIESANITVGDYLVFTKTKKENQFLSREYARLLGYYVSEGFIIKQRTGKKKDGPYRDMGVAFSFSLDERDTYVEEILTILKTLKLNPKIYESENKNECRISVYSQELAKTLKNYGNEYSETKCLHPTIFTQDDEILYEILGAAVNGDGSQDKKTGNIRYTSVSEKLARTVRRLCLELGISASISKYRSSSDYGTCTAYNVFIPSSFSSKLSEYSSKVDKFNKNTSTRLFNLEDHILFPIQAIEEIDEEITVCNLQIEDDETYQALDYVTHNCTICEKRASKADEYCTHIKTEKNKIYFDGRKVAMVNTRPRFFDISFVTIPADRGGYMMRKVAGYAEAELSAKLGEEWLKENSLKESDIDKKLNVFPEVEVLTQFHGRLQPPKEHPGNLPKEWLDESLNKVSASQLLTSMGFCQIFPTAKDFQYIILRGEDEKIAEELYDKNVTFKLEKTAFKIPSDWDVTNLADTALNQCAKVAQTHSLTAPNIVTRELIKLSELIDMNIDLLSNPSDLKDKAVRVTQTSEAYLNKNPLFALGLLSGLFYAFHKFGSKIGLKNARTMSSLEAAVLKHPILLPILVGGVSLGAVKLQENTNPPNPQYNVKDNIDYTFTKTAKSGYVLERLLTTIPGTYIYAGSQETKRQRGVRLNTVQDFIRKHPFLSSLGVFAASKPLFSAGAKAMGKYGSLSSNIFLTLKPERYESFYTELMNLT